MSVTVIGGATVDISGFAAGKLISGDSNPGRIQMCCGGVGRNIAENLGRLGVETKLLTAVGRDVYGQMILENCEAAHVDAAGVVVRDDLATSVDLALHDGDGNMVLSIADMRAAESIEVDFLHEQARSIGESALIVLDTNLKRECIEYIVSRFADIDIFVDAVAVAKAARIEKLPGQLHTVKMNKLEAEALVGRELDTEPALEAGSQELLDSGMRQVFISMGAGGTCAADREGVHFFRAAPVTIVNDRGAGDAFMAGLVFAHLQGFSLEKTSRFAMATAGLTLRHEKTVSPEMSLTAIRNVLQDAG